MTYYLQTCMYICKKNELILLAIQITMNCLIIYCKNLQINILINKHYEIHKYMGTNKQKLNTVPS